MYKSIDELVERIDERNSDGKISTLIGVSIDKCFINSVANINGTDLTKYKIIRRDDFAVSLMQVSRDSKIPIARLKDYDQAIMSPVYPIFRVRDTSVILPEYLEMWFMRPEFDREAAFIAVGGVRGSMPWEEFAKMRLPVPSLEKQHQIVRAYQIVADRIEIKRRINDNLRASAETEFFRQIRYPKIQELPFQDTEIGDYPSDWILTTLGQTLSTIIDRRGLTPTKLGGEWSHDGIIAISAKSVKNHELINLDIANRVDRELYERWMPQKLQPHDILMTSEAPLGEFYFIADFSEYCLSQRLFAMRANTEIVYPTVLYFQLTDSIGKHQIDIRKTGTTVTGIRQSELVQVPVILPPKQVQQSFARFCNPIMLSIERNSAEIRALSKVKTMILAQLSSR